MPTARTRTPEIPAGSSLPLSLLVLVGCACGISLITFGVRSIFGLFTDPVVATHAWSRDVFALAIALQNLVWGLTQPFAGALVDRFGPVRVLAAGGLVYALGIVLMAVGTTPLELHLSAGVLVGLGMGGASYITVLGALGRLVPESRRAWALGVGTAAGSLGQFVFAPLGQAFIGGYGWQQAALVLAGFVLLVPLLATGLRGSPAASAGSGTGGGPSLAATLGSALRHPSYLFLLLGFSVCGFQLAFITIHLPPYLNDQGVSASVAGWAIGAIGLANVLGAYAAGLLAARFTNRRLLSVIYFGRALTIALFLVIPVSPWTVMPFATVMGLLWLSTIPPTSALVALMFGTRFMGTLFGLVFLSHQVGSFLGIWLGGAVFELTAGYDAIWWLTVAFGVVAGFLHLPIAERPAPAFAAAATAPG
ncbi:MFS transporter [Aquisalimonas lutea]|uniref:MFS transporter n=1 Tax=Aquisalimonas lutea TaxID=1327750 RepID=UPI0025B33DAD|nr:MFS transporter [Aquisalimonas lutea]MDN3519551.1 MFS transporter [Aquisalimonas lutea]